MLMHGFKVGALTADAQGVVVFGFLVSGTVHIGWPGTSSPGLALGQTWSMFGQVSRPDRYPASRESCRNCTDLPQLLG